jgi:hypothetical protein
MMMMMMCNVCVTRYIFHRLFLGDFMFVRARRPLSAGEELTFSYCDPLDPLDERRDEMQRRCGYQCACELCQDQEVFEDEEPRKAAVSVVGWA